jgi:hypothetical protein
MRNLWVRDSEQMLKEGVHVPARCRALGRWRIAHLKADSAPRSPLSIVLPCLNSRQRASNACRPVEVCLRLYKMKSCAVNRCHGSELQLQCKYG